MSDTNRTAETVRAEGAQDRERNGRFARGNAGGPGNPYTRRVAELRGAIYRVVNEEDIEAVFNALLVKAKEGHVQAAKIVLSYSLGKAQAGADADRTDLHEWEIQKETAPIFQEAAEVSKTPSPELALDITRTMRPIVAEVQAGQFSGMLKKETRRERKARKKAEREGRGRQPKGAPLANGVFDSESLRVGPSVP